MSECTYRMNSIPAPWSKSIISVTYKDYICKNVLVAYCGYALAGEKDSWITVQLNVTAVFFTGSEGNYDLEMKNEYLHGRVQHS